MKPIYLLFIFFSCCHFTHGQADSKYFAFKGNYSISLYGGGAEIIGKIGDELFPLVNPSISYHLTDRFSLVGEAILYTSGPGRNDESNQSLYLIKQLTMVWRYAITPKEI
jgi:hypothetical protein